MISVVVSVYNMERYLDRCIESLLNQTYQDFELILVDDGSTDNSPKMCDEWASKNDKISVIHKPNGGLPSARNCGIEHANGEFIIFPDPDDWVAPQYLERLLSLRSEYQADLSICGRFRGDVIMDKDATLSVMDMEDALEKLMYPSSFCGFAWNKLYSMNVIKQNDLRYDEELLMLQDLHFNVRYFQLCSKIVYDPAPLYHYSIDTGGVTTSQTTLTPRKLSGLLSYQKISEIAHDKYPRVEEISYCAMCNWCLRYMIIYYTQKVRSRDILSNIRKLFREYSRFFYSCDIYGWPDKSYSRLALIHPYLYYTAYRIVGHWNHFFGKNK